jgi:hypothetical protein
MAEKDQLSCHIFLATGRISNNYMESAEKEYATTTMGS